MATAATAAFGDPPHGSFASFAACFSTSGGTAIANTCRHRHIIPSTTPLISRRSSPDWCRTRTLSLLTLRALLQQSIDEVKRNGVGPEEVERAKLKIVAGQLRSLERGSARADLLNAYEMWLGDPGYLPRDLARYRAVTPQAVQAFARKYLPDDRRLELTTVPAGRKTASAP